MRARTVRRGQSVRWRPIRRGPFARPGPASVLHRARTGPRARRNRLPPPGCTRHRAELRSIFLSPATVRPCAGVRCRGAVWRCCTARTVTVRVRSAQLLVKGDVLTGSEAGTVLTVDFTSAGRVLGSTTVTADGSGRGGVPAVLRADVADGASVVGDVCGAARRRSRRRSVRGPDGDADGVPDWVEARTAERGTDARAPARAWPRCRWRSAAPTSPSTPAPAVAPRAGRSPRRRASRRTRSPTGCSASRSRRHPGGGADGATDPAGGRGPTGYAKWDPATGAVTDFSFDGTTGAVFDSNVVTLHLVDGGRGDADGVVNGVIVDPGGPTGLPPLVQTFYVPLPEPQLLGLLADDQLRRRRARCRPTSRSPRSPTGRWWFTTSGRTGTRPTCSNPTQIHHADLGRRQPANGAAPGVAQRPDRGRRTSSSSTTRSTRPPRWPSTSTGATSSPSPRPWRSPAWPGRRSRAVTGPLFAEGVEVYDTGNWGTDFRAPVGVNLADGRRQRHVQLHRADVMAAQVRHHRPDRRRHERHLRDHHHPQRGAGVPGQRQRPARGPGARRQAGPGDTADRHARLELREPVVLDGADRRLVQHLLHARRPTTTTHPRPRCSCTTRGTSAITVGWRTVRRRTQTSFMVAAGATVRKTLPTNTGGRSSTAPAASRSTR